MKRILFSAVAIAALWTGSAIQSSRAQWVVVDPTNLVENIISALQSTQTVLNQVTQISHEVQSLAFQVQNLQQMPTSVSAVTLSQYTNQFSQLAAAMRNINGIAANVANLTTKY